MASASTCLTSKFATPCPIRFAEARSAISAVRSMPQTRPASPTIILATNRSKPAPQPISRTTLPGGISPREKGLPTPQKEARKRSLVLLIMAGGYPRVWAPCLPVGYLNFPAAETETSEYFFLMAFLISCRFCGDSSAPPELVVFFQPCFGGVPESGPSKRLSSWQPPAPDAGAQPWALFLTVSSLNMVTLLFLFRGDDLNASNKITALRMNS